MDGKVRVGKGHTMCTCNYRKETCILMLLHIKSFLLFYAPFPLNVALIISDYWFHNSFWDEVPIMHTFFSN